MQARSRHTDPTNAQSNNDLGDRDCMREQTFCEVNCLGNHKLKQRETQRRVRRYRLQRERAPSIGALYIDLVVETRGIEPLTS